MFDWGTLGGGLIGGAANLFGQNSANSANAEAQAEANRQSYLNQKDAQMWQEMMSNTSYQRAMKDMKAAGLNPMLAFGQGGASSPSSPMASAQANKRESVTKDSRIGETASAAAAMALNSKSVEADIGNKQKQQEVMETQKDLNTKQGQQAVANANSAQAQADFQALQSMALKNSMPKSVAEGQFYNKYGKAAFYTPYNMPLLAGDSLGKALKGVNIDALKEKAHNSAKSIMSKTDPGRSELVQKLSNKYENYLGRK